MKCDVDGFNQFFRVAPARSAKLWRERRYNNRSVKQWLMLSAIISFTFHFECALFHGSFVALPIKASKISG